MIVMKFGGASGIPRVVDQQSRGRRRGVISVVAALVLVSAFWGARVVRNRRLADLRSQAKPWEMLAAIKPPANARPIGKALEAVRKAQQDDKLSAEAAYEIDSDCKSVETYYKEEFGRHGFTALYLEPHELSFCGSHYQALLGCKSDRQFTQHEQGVYVIHLKWTDDAC